MVKVIFNVLLELAYSRWFKRFIYVFIATPIENNYRRDSLNLNV